MFSMNARCGYASSSDGGVDGVYGPASPSRPQVLTMLSMPCRMRSTSASSTTRLATRPRSRLPSAFTTSTRDLTLSATHRGPPSRSGGASRCAASVSTSTPRRQCAWPTRFSSHAAEDRITCSAPIAARLTSLLGRSTSSLMNSRSSPYTSSRKKARTASKSTFRCVRSSLAISLTKMASVSSHCFIWLLRLWCTSMCTDWPLSTPSTAPSHSAVEDDSAVLVSDGSSGSTMSAKHTRQPRAVSRAPCVRIAVRSARTEVLRTSGRKSVHWPLSAVKSDSRSVSTCSGVGAGAAPGLRAGSAPPPPMMPPR